MDRARCRSSPVHRTRPGRTRSVTVSADVLFATVIVTSGFWRDPASCPMCLWLTGAGISMPHCPVRAVRRSRRGCHRRRNDHRFDVRNLDLLIGGERHAWIQLLQECRSGVKAFGECLEPATCIRRPAALRSPSCRRAALDKWPGRVFRRDSIRREWLLSAGRLIAALLKQFERLLRVRAHPAVDRTRREPARSSITWSCSASFSVGRLVAVAMRRRWRRDLGGLCASASTIDTVSDEMRSYVILRFQ